MNTKGERRAWAAPIPATPRSKFAAYEEACRTTKFDRVFDSDWSFREELRTRAKRPASAKAMQTKADILESMLGL